MKVVLFTPDLEIVYEQGVAIIYYCYQEIIQIIAALTI
jgi:hypothetical protein